MKAFLLVVLLVSSGLNAQQTINGTIEHGGVTREYILYVPANYTGTTAVPLMFNFHGYTSNAFEQMWYGDFRPIADTAGFLIVHPQGTLDDSNQPHFNVGWGTSTADDLGFTEALIDSLLLDYTIDESRIYTTGMSNGGYMSFYIACNLSDRFAAVGSVTGAMVPAVMTSCNATHPTPVIQIHGTSDATVPYNGGAGWSSSIAEILTHWSGFNNCDPVPTVTPLPDINMTDGSTVEKTLYVNGDNCTEVVHFKVNNGGHTWPGNAFGSPGTNYDINASVEIWNFVSRFDLNGLINCASMNVTETEQMNTLFISPNPVKSSFTVHGEINGTTTYEVYSTVGKRVLSGTVTEANSTIDVSELAQDMYVLMIGGQRVKLIKTNEF